MVGAAGGPVRVVVALVAHGVELGVAIAVAVAVAVAGAAAGGLRGLLRVACDCEQQRRRVLVRVGPKEVLRAEMGLVASSVVSYEGPVFIRTRPGVGCIGWYHGFIRDTGPRGLAVCSIAGQQFRLWAEDVVQIVGLGAAQPQGLRHMRGLPQSASRWTPGQDREPWMRPWLQTQPGCSIFVLLELSPSSGEPAGCIGRFSHVCRSGLACVVGQERLFCPPGAVFQIVVAPRWPGFFD